jgi:hypothetical protein
VPFRAELREELRKEDELAARREHCSARCGLIHAHRHLWGKGGRRSEHMNAAAASSMPIVTDCSTARDEGGHQHAISMQSVAISSTHRLLDAPDEERVVAALAQLDLEIEQRGERRGGEAAHEHLWGNGERGVGSGARRGGRVHASGAWGAARRWGAVVSTSRFASSTARYLWGGRGRARAVVSTCMRSGRAVGWSAPW